MKIILIIIGALLILVLGTFAWFACILSSRCKISDYEDWDRGDFDGKNK